MFIAILTQAYAEIQDDLQGEEDFSGIFGSIKNRIKAAMKMDDFDGDGDGKVSAQELAEQTGISVERAQAIIAEYDEDNDGQLDEAEFERLKERVLTERESERQELVPESLIRAVSERVDASSGISAAQFGELKSEMREMKQLLRTVLEHTAAGKRALRRSSKANK